MGSVAKKMATPPLVNAPPLITALNQSQQVKDKVEECAQDLSSINEVLKNEATDHLPIEQVEQVLLKSEEVEVKVQECAADLSEVNHALATEIRERKRLERKLNQSNIALVDTQSELSDTQSELFDTQAQEKRARHIALHDVVTGLPNRSLCIDRLKTALAQARRHSWRLAVMFIDLDEFKRINDSHGHDVGDKVLCMVAARLQESVRGSDTVGRYGGDEFIYLMLEVNDEADVAKSADKIVASISQPWEFNALKLTMKPSIGIAMFPEDGRSASVLLKNADSAMYNAKQSDTGYAFYAARSAWSPARAPDTSAP